MQQEEQREEWIRRHTWGATAMEQGEQRELPYDDELAAEGMVGPSGDEEKIPAGKRQAAASGRAMWMFRRRT